MLFVGTFGVCQLCASSVKYGRAKLAVFDMGRLKMMPLIAQAESLRYSSARLIMGVGQRRSSVRCRLLTRAVHCAS